MLFILVFFVSHWYLSLFCQTFFLHRYSAHQMFTMNKFWERFFYLLTFLCQGSSFLNPRGYAILHRLHHSYSDTIKDPHSPMQHSNVFTMMFHTAKVYIQILRSDEIKDPNAKGYYPEWKFLDRFATSWTASLTFGTIYTAIYVIMAPSAWYYLLIPVHYMMGPVHGAIVNWCGHKYGYRNFKDCPDNSKNTFRFDFLTMGELFQNNHHKYGKKINFAVKSTELDPTYQVIRFFNAVGIINVKNNSVNENNNKKGSHKQAA